MVPCCHVLYAVRGAASKEFLSGGTSIYSNQIGVAQRPETLLCRPFSYSIPCRDEKTITKLPSFSKILNNTVITFLTRHSPQVSQKRPPKSCVGFYRKLACAAGTASARGMTSSVMTGAEASITNPEVLAGGAAPHAAGIAPPPIPVYLSTPLHSPGPEAGLYADGANDGGGPAPML